MLSQLIRPTVGFKALVAPVVGCLVRNFEAVEVNVPSMGESITEGTISSWFVRPGDKVQADQVVASIETDKISVDVNAPLGGKLVSVDAAEGDTVFVGNRLFVIDSDGVDTDAPSSDHDAFEGGARSAEETAVKSVPAKPECVESNKQPNASDSQPHNQSKCRSEDRKQMSRMRQRIAERLKSAQSEGVLLTTFQEVDMSAVMELRKRLGAEITKKTGTKLGFMSFFMAASSRALQRFPSLNSVIENKDIVTPSYVDISVAVATPNGLTVPVVKNVHKKSLIQLEKDLLELAALARDNKLSLEQMNGGTFTISNGGIYGSMMGTPIINPPQSAILGMHSIVQRSVVRDNQVVIKPVMYLALTYDHRIVDGREAVSFLKTVADYIEDPARLLVD